jgi:ankyrin repeat protein
MLYSAARSGHLSVVRMLVEEFGADVNRRNESEDGSSPLHGTSHGGHGDVVRYLLQRGADASRKNNYKERPRTPPS